VLGSTLTRESDGVIYTLAGPEIGVASTKAYTQQLSAFYMVAFYLAEIRLSCRRRRSTGIWMISGRYPAFRRNPETPGADRAFRAAPFAFRIVPVPRPQYQLSFRARRCVELKEISYVPAEGYAAGEMKHGPIALIDEYRAVVCIAPASRVYDKMVSNIQEIKSRNGMIIIIATEGDTKIRN
jgi:glucosamine--fructose-6-phosphate aminotransferase (isomerizing)